jgi:Ca-activated chloride channel family protein
MKTSIRTCITIASLALLLQGGASYGIDDVSDPLDGLVDAQLIDEGGHIIQFEDEVQVIKGMGKVRLEEILKRTDERLGDKSVSLPPMPDPPADDRPSGPYLYAQKAKGKALLPLREMTADVRIAGVIAHATVTQVFGNDGTVPIEAVYVFPASTRAAVHAMRMRIGERTVEARIDEREKAKKKYEQAKSQGKAASLLEQQRPNAFTMRVANIMPGAEIEVELEYSELLVPEDGTYELVFPTVVGPRYPGGVDTKKDGWIVNPYLPQGKKEPYRFDIVVDVEAPIPIQKIASPSHSVKVKNITDSRAHVGLVGTGGGTRDFVLRYRLADKSIESGVMLFEDENGGGHFVVMMEPPAKPKASQVSPREYIFVLDVSGSMHGFPLETARTLMKKLLGDLGPGDYFNVVLFAGSSATLGKRSIEATKANVKGVVERIDDLEGGGGTELMEALETAYAIPDCDEEGLSRTVVVITDGYVGVEAQAFKFVRENLGDANLFAFGIGSSVNRALIEGLSRAGMGEPFVVLDPPSAKGEASRFRSYIGSPVLTDIRASFEGLGVIDVLPHPDKIPDLMARRPVVLIGRYEGEAKGTIRIRGKQGKKTFKKTFKVGKAGSGEANRPIRWLWARRWVDTLEDQLFLLPDDDDLAAAITLVGLDYSMLTSRTSFVAVDSKVLHECGKVVTVKQPLPMPSGVSNLALAGMGSGGGGSGMGTIGLGALGSIGKGSSGFASGSFSAPKLVMAAAQIKGMLSKDVIRDVIRQHKNEIRGCYQQALLSDSGLEGRIVVRFVIDSATGQVVSVSIVDTELESQELEACVAVKVKTWSFPTLDDGGTIVVNYPFLLQIAGDEDG